MISLTSDLQGLHAPTPFDVVAPHGRPVRRLKRELLAATRQLERRLMTRRVQTVLVSFQDRQHLTTRSREQYARLARDGAQVFAYARGLVPDYRPESWELRTVALLRDDPLVSEWDIVVLGDGLAEAFVARDLSPAAEVVGKDLDRPFSWTSTTDPALVQAAAEAMLSRVPAAHR